MTDEAITCPTDVEQLNEMLTRPTPQVLDAIAKCAGDFAVLGASGKMGFHFALMLQRTLRKLGRNDKVLAVARFSSEDTIRPFEQAGIATVRADLSQADDLAALPQVANVLFLAGVKFGTSSSPELLTRMNVEMPRQVAAHFRDSRIVALSTGCVYAFTTPESGGSRETDRTDPPGEYAKSCLGREKAFAEGSAKHGTQTVLIRLNYAVEPRYGVLVDIARKVAAGEPVSVEMGYVNVIWQGDAVAQILQCFAWVDSPPRVINITGREVLRVRDLASQFGQQLGRKVTFTGSEAPTAWLNNSEWACTHLGEPPTSLATMIQCVSRWIQQGGPILGKPTHFENREGAY